MENLEFYVFQNQKTRLDENATNPENDHARSVSIAPSGEVVASGYGGTSLDGSKPQKKRAPFWVSYKPSGVQATSPQVFPKYSDDLIVSGAVDDGAVFMGGNVSRKGAGVLLRRTLSP